MEDKLKLVSKFINTTSSHIFLTGKAGTGKTTFLKSLSSITHKNFIVVAPTGIAALNAGGVTLHSQFLLPPVLFIPDRDFKQAGSDTLGIMNPNLLARKYPLNAARKQVLRFIDLLVIDEVSMLRADILDAVDYRMRAARGNRNESFGGVQVLFIGDLLQLTPVVRNDEKSLFNQYYSVEGFYGAKALEKEELVYIELDKIYRQSHPKFIDILNRLRSQTYEREDIEELNLHYKTPEQIQEIREVITLTTHNAKADSINNQELKNLKGNSFFFQAKIEGDFPDNIFPVSPKLELKLGAQIMFIRNDKENQAYFNGKLALVKEIKDEDIWVELAESHTLYKLKREKWENKKYSLNPHSNLLEEEFIGSFEQYPIKLAWAITIHKSQGLSFDKAILDLGNAFAGGQIYVALSRLRSLEGLILSSKIQSWGIKSEGHIQEFVKSLDEKGGLEEILKKDQFRFIKNLIEKTFDFFPIIRELEYIQRDRVKKGEFEEDSIKPFLLQLEEGFRKETNNTHTFRTQLFQLLEKNPDQFLERLNKGCQYYKSFFSRYQESVLRHLETLKSIKGVKAYSEQVSEIEQNISKRMEELDKASMVTESILKGKDSIPLEELQKNRLDERKARLEKIQAEFPQGKTLSRKTSPKRKALDKKIGEAPKKSTHEVTLELLEQGFSIAEIANKRELSLGTIESHLVLAISFQKISLLKLLPQNQIDEIEKNLGEMPKDFALKDLFEKMKGKYSYGLIKAVIENKKNN